MDSRDSDGDGLQPGIEDAQGILGAIQRLCDENDRLRTATTTAERECATLRDEVTALRGQLEAFRRERNQITEALSDRLKSVTPNAPPRLNGSPREVAHTHPAPSAVSDQPARMSPFSKP